MASVAPDAAAKVLDQATHYAFTGTEELEFIEIYRSTGEPIVDSPDDAEYDVTVLKVDYRLQGAVPSTDAAPSEANMGDGYSSSAGWEQAGGSSVEEAQSSWLQVSLTRLVFFHPSFGRQSSRSPTVPFLYFSPLLLACTDRRSQSARRRNDSRRHVPVQAAPTRPVAGRRSLRQG